LWPEVGALTFSRSCESNCRVSSGGASLSAPTGAGAMHMQKATAATQLMALEWRDRMSGFAMI
jgi:hypothetical protein